MPMRLEIRPRKSTYDCSSQAESDNLSPRARRQRVVNERCDTLVGLSREMTCEHHINCRVCPTATFNDDACRSTGLIS